MHVRSLPNTVLDYNFRSLPNTVLDCNFSLDVVEVLHEWSGMMRKEAYNVIDSCLYTMYEGAMRSY
jgi:hypothetical protein